MIISCLLVVFASVSSFAATDLEGFWQGTVERDGESMPIQARFELDGDTLTGALDLPEFGSLGVPLHESSVKRSRVNLDFRLWQARYVLDGKVKGDVFEGTWEWPGQSIACDVRLERVPDPRPYTAEDVEFYNGDVRIAGTVFTPKGPGPYPGIVVIHGSGNNVRWQWENKADLFARNGMVCLFFDKRGSGESSGDWEKVGFEPLARDGIAGIHFLQSREDVIKEKVGFWGISQAGWIMPLAASLSEDVAFIVVTSGATVTVKEEGYYDYIVKLRDAGFSEGDQLAARRIFEMDDEVTITGEGYEELRAAVREAVKEPWWKPLGYFALPAHSPDREFYRLIVEYDPVPILRGLDLPMLWIYGDEDKSVEPELSIGILRPIIEEGDKPWTVRSFANADHGIRVPPEPGAAFPLRKNAEGYLDAIVDWLQANGFTGN